MVSALFLDKYLENFIFSALELCGYDYSAELASEPEAVVCDENNLENAVSYCKNQEIIPPVILVSRNKAANLKSVSDGVSQIRFLSYPFLLKDFLSILRMSQAHESNKMPESENEVIFDSENGVVLYKGREVRLTDREAILFDYLFKRRGVCVSRGELNCAVWDRSRPESNVAEVYISYLRRKLTPLFGSGAITSVRGNGYILNI